MTIQKQKKASICQYEKMAKYFLDFKQLRGGGGGKDKTPVFKRWYFSKLRLRLFCSRFLICSFYTVLLDPKAVSNAQRSVCQQFFLVSKHLNRGRLVLYFQTDTGRLLLAARFCRMNTCHEYRPFVCWLQRTPGELMLALIFTSLSHAVSPCCGSPASPPPPCIHSSRLWFNLTWQWCI